MGNIIGNAFDGWVDKQILWRQKYIGLNRTLEQLDAEDESDIYSHQAFELIEERDNIIKWMNTKTCFLRLASSIDVDDNFSMDLQDWYGASQGTTVSDEVAGSILAQKCVLMNGVTSVAQGINHPDLPSSEEFEDRVLPTGDNSNINFTHNIEGAIGAGRNDLNRDKLLDSLEGSYGFGGTNFGFRPMPGLQAAQVSFYNRGSLSKASIQIKAFNKTQFEIINTLYMKLGYNILLEWGWSVYIDSTGQIVNRTMFTSKPLEMLFKGEESYDIMSSIGNERLKYSGNYDAFFGKITNFNWKFNTDGTYDITLSAISIGDVVESLKINKSMNINLEELASIEEEQLLTISEDDSEMKKAKKEKYNAKLKKELDGRTIVVKNQNKTTFNNWLYNVKVDLDNSYRLNSMSSVGVDKYTALDKWIVPPYTPDDYTNTKAFRSKMRKALLSVSFNQKNTSSEKDNNDPVKKDQYYCKLGYMLEYIQRKLLIYDGTTGNPVFKIDYNWETTPPDYRKRWKINGGYTYTGSPIIDGKKTTLEEMCNYCLTTPAQISTDPTVCLIPMVADDELKSFLPETIRPTKDNPVLNWVFPSERSQGGREIYTGLGFKTDNPYLGRLMHIHINLDYIATVLDDSIDKEGNIDLYSFLDNLMAGVSDSLGNINKFSVTFDSEKLSIVIRDDSNLRYGELIKRPDLTKFEVYGVNSPSGGSFCSEVGFTATVSKEFATMISIGSQSNGNQVGTNATAFSSINKGLTDRTSRTKLDASTLAKKDVAFIDNFNALSKSDKNALVKASGYKDLGEYTKAAKGRGLSPKGQFSENLERVYLYLLRIYNSRWLNSNDIDELKSMNRDISNYYVGHLAQEKKTPPPFFIPFDLNVKMVGLSGMRIYEKFSINDAILPRQYHPNTVNFLIKGITHDISADQWSTTLTSVTVPSEPKTNTPKWDYIKLKGEKLGAKKEQLLEDAREEANILADENKDGYPTKTITSGWPVIAPNNRNGLIYKTDRQTTPKRQIYLHHTAGHQKPKQTVVGFCKSTINVGTHYCIDNTGHAEQIYADKYYANHNSRPYLAKQSLAIELNNIGWLTLYQGRYYPWFDKAKDSNGNRTGGHQYLKSNAFNLYKSYNQYSVKSVDANGKEISYKGYRYWEAYTDPQIEALRKVLVGWMDEHSIPFVYNYDDLWPPIYSNTKNKSSLYKSTKASQLVPGIYTHNSTQYSGKWDVSPQPKLIAMLKKISS